METVADVPKALVNDPAKLAYCTQTTLSVEDTADIVTALKARFPAIEGPRREDICYATTNRQNAVRKIAPLCDALIVIGAPNSSNSMRLVETAKGHGCPKALLIQRADAIDWDWIAGTKTLGLTAGASAPEILVREILTALKTRYTVSVTETTIAEEHVTFKLPRAVSG